jgi:serine-type D-Ala-D-Ala carboxypeptidase (penicillin-binding protein 5/6)
VSKTSNTAKIIALALILQCVAAPCAWAETTAEPAVAARAWVLTDVRSGEYLAGEDASERLPMASTTKIMTALVALEETDLDEEVTVSQRAAAFATPAYSNVGLFAGDVLSVRELLKAALISSGDDAAYALAEHLGDGSVRDFVAKMNREAETLGLENTHFENPVGFDARDQYSSARDLAEMARLAMGHPEFREMVATEYATITTQDREIPLANTNDLLFVYPPATGVKTGTTPRSGPSLVASAASGNESYISVILDAREDRFAASIRELEHGFAAYDRVNLVAEGKQYSEADLPYRRGETVDLVAKENVDGLVDGNSRVERGVKVFEDMPPSARPGTKLGAVVVRVDGEIVGESPLVARKGYEEASLWERVWYTVEGIFA